MIKNLFEVNNGRILLLWHLANLSIENQIVHNLDYSELIKIFSDKKMQKN